MEIQFDINHQHLVVQSGYYVVSNSENYITAKFTFSDDWEDMTKTAVFRQSGSSVAYQEIIEDGYCNIPHEVTQYPGMRIYVQGKNDETTIYTNAELIRVHIDGANDRNDVGTVDTPSGGAVIVIDDTLLPDSLNAISNAAVYAEFQKTVYKADGMGLSQNSYTDEEKEKLAGIAEGAEVNVQSDWKQTNADADDYIKNKPTKLSEFENDSGYTTSADLDSLAESVAADVKGIADTHNAHKTAAVLDHPDGSVTEAKIADSAVTTDKLADGAVTAEKITDGVLFSGKYDDLEGVPTEFPPSGHSHTVGDITDLAEWAKQPVKPTYTADEVGALTADGTAVRASADADGNNIPDTYATKVQVDGLSGDVTEVKGEVGELKGDIVNIGYYNLADVELVEGQYVSHTGGFGLMGVFKRTGYVPLSDSLRKIIVLNTFHYGSDSIAFYDSNKNFIGSYHDNTKTGEYVILDVPYGTKYFAISGFTSDNLKVYYYDIISSLSDELSDKQSKSVSNKLLNNIKNVKFDSDSGISFDGDNLVQTYDSTEGNRWWRLSFNVNDTSKNFIKLVCNILEISGALQPFLFGTKKDGSQFIGSIYKQITEVGTHEFDLDLNHYSVYENLDITKPLSIGFANAGVVRCVYDRIDIYSLDTELDTSKTLVENMDIMLKSIESNKNAISSIKSSTSEMTSPNGSKFILQVSDNGELIAVPKIPSSILYIGNSLLGGFGFGMAATNSREDYYYKVNSYIEGKGKTLIKDKLMGVGYEGTTNEEQQDTWLNNTLLPNLNENLELVIIQLGDNVNTDERVSAFENGTKKMIRFIREHAPKSRVTWVGEWYSNSTKQTYISNACAECGATFIDISDLPNVSGNQAKIGDVVTKDDGTTVTIDNAGVASHPSNQGMTQIANRIIENLFE